MIYDFVYICFVQALICGCLIGIDVGSVLYAVEDGILQSQPFHIRHNLSSYLSRSAVQHSHDDGLASWSAHAPGAAECSIPRLLRRVHILQFSADESLIDFHFATLAADLLEAPGTQGHTDTVKHEPCRLLG